MESITIDGLDENEFRRSIQAMLRNGEADDAAAKLRALIAPYAGPGKPLPERFLTVTPEEITLPGWHELHHRIGQYDRPENRISALRIAFTEPDPEAPAPLPDSCGRLAPLIETSYFSDTSFPFSEADRADLLDGYSMDDSAWQGDHEAADSVIRVEGIEDLYGAVASLEAKVMASSEPDDESICAGSLGACFLAVLVHQAVGETVRKEGLPRALCVLAGQDNIYPFFDAPVVARDEFPDQGVRPMMPLATATSVADEPELESDETNEGPYDYGRLSGATMRKVKKTPVLLLDAAEATLAAHEVEVEAERQMTAADDGERASLLAVHDHGHDAPGLSAASHPATPVEEAPAPAEAVAEWLPEPVEAFAPEESETHPEPGPELVLEALDEPALPPAEASQEPETQPEPVAEAIAPLPETEPQPAPQAEWEPEMPAYEPAALARPVTANSSVRALRARLATPVEPEPQSSGLGALLRRFWAWLGF